jgi:hypothetical protein
MFLITVQGVLQYLNSRSTHSASYDPIIGTEINSSNYAVCNRVAC